MAIYIDTVERMQKKDHSIFAGTNYCHLTADTEKELLIFAASIKLPDKWMRGTGSWRFHFDICGSMMTKIRRDERVKEITRDEFRLMQQRKPGGPLAGQAQKQINRGMADMDNRMRMPGSERRPMTPQEDWSRRQELEKQADDYRMREPGE